MRVVGEARLSRLVVRDAVHRHGRPFEPTVERRLEPVARRVIKALPGAAEDVVAFREAAGPFGVPDFTVLVGGRRQLAERRRLGASPVLNDVDARIVVSVDACRPSSLESVARRAFVPVGLVRSRVPRLVREGVLSWDRDRDALTRSAVVGPLGNIYAVEMKVADWRRGLYQCRRYLVWADSYVLVVGQVSDSALDVLTREVARDGGGLVCGGVTIRVPSLGRSVPSLRLLAAEHLVAAFG